MIPIANDPVPDSGRDNLSDLIRQMPESGLLVAKTVRSIDGHSKLYVVRNGRQEEYCVLRIYNPSTTGGKGAEFYQYVGKLTPEQMGIIERIVEDSQEHRVRTTSEQLKDCAPALKRNDGLWKDFKGVAKYAAFQVGYSFRGYLLHKTTTRNPDALPPSPPANAPAPPFHGDEDDPFSYDIMLMALRQLAPRDPHAALEKALQFLELLGQEQINMLTTALLPSCAELAFTQFEYGCCRPQTVQEKRARGKLKKHLAIQDAIGKSLARIANDMPAKRSST